MQHYHQYEYRDVGPHSSEIVRERLRGRPARTFQTPDEAAAWHRQWMDEVVRPAGVMDLDHVGQAAAKDQKAEYTRRQLEIGQDFLDGFWSGQQFIAATLIPCPPRVIPGFPEPPPCPTGHR